MEVVPDVNLICLGDINGRLQIREPNIETDCNGRMIEEWTEKLSLHHLNQSRKCIETYTYGKPGGPRSTIDHVLVNNTMMEHFRGMFIDENMVELNMSDHSLVKTWFNLSKGEKNIWKKSKFEKKIWKKSKFEKKIWYKKDPESLKKMEREVERILGKKTGFYQIKK